MLHGPFHNAQLSWGERSQGQPPYWPRDAGLKVNAQSFFRRLALTAVHLVSKCLPTTCGQSLHAGGARHWRSNQKPCAPIAPRRLGPTGGQGTLELIAMNFSGGATWSPVRTSPCSAVIWWSLKFNRGAQLGCPG